MDQKKPKILHPKAPQLTTDVRTLVHRAQKGDHEAFLGLIQLSQSKLYRFCVYLCGNSNLAQDLCQDVYVKVFEHIHSVTDPDGFLSWLFRVAKNRYLDHLKRAETRLTKPTEDIELENPGDVAPEHRYQSCQDVQRTLSQMETDDRVLLLLIDLEEYSYKEAAETLGLSEDTVRGRLVRARAAFKKLHSSK